jgi:hypothetical protein
MGPSDLDDEVSGDFGLSHKMMMQMSNFPLKLGRRLELIDMNSWVFPSCRHSVIIHEIGRPFAFSETDAGRFDMSRDGGRFQVVV